MFLHQVKVGLAGTGRTIFRGLYLSKRTVHLKVFLFQIRTWTTTWVNKNQRMTIKQRNGNEETDIFDSVATVHVHTMIPRDIETKMLRDQGTWNALLDRCLAMLHDHAMKNEYLVRYIETVHDREMSISLGGDIGSTELTPRLTVLTLVIIQQHRTMISTHVSRRNNTLVTTDHNSGHHHDWRQAPLRLQ